MKASNDLSVAVLANPVQAEALSWMLRVTPPSRRLSVAAAFLGTSVAQIFEASGMNSEDRAYYARRRGHCDLPSAVMVRLAKALDVPFVALWDDEALERPVVVLQAQSHLGNGGVKDEGSRRSREKRARDARAALRLAAG